MALLLLLFVPDTPFSLLLKGEREEAKRGLRRLRGKDFDADAEILNLEDALDEVKAQGKVGIIEVFTKTVYLKPMLILLGLQFLANFTGILGISLYMTEIFIKAGFDEDKSLFYSAAVASAQVVGIVVLMLVVDRIGRRPALLVSSVGVCLSLVALGTFFYYDTNVEVVCPDGEEESSNMSTTTVEPCYPRDGFSQETVDSLSWLPLTSLFMFKFFHVFGLSPMPTILCGEFFSSEAKDISTLINISFFNLCGFLVSRYQVGFPQNIKAIYIQFSNFQSDM